MRISTLQIYQSGLNNITNAQTGLAKTQEQVSSGKRIQTAADDPPGMALNDRLIQERELLEQYQRNIDVAERDLELEESQLDSTQNLMVRFKELVIQAGDGALSKSELGSLISEASAIRDQLLGIMNTRSANGEYLFAGGQGFTQPFVDSSLGAVEYQGDQRERELEIAAGVDVQVRDTGRELFVEIPAANKTFYVDKIDPNSPDASVGRITNQDQNLDPNYPAYESIYPADIRVRYWNTTPPAPLDPSGDGYYRITALTSPAININIPNTPGEPMNFLGVEMTVSDTPDIAANTSTDYYIRASTTQPLLTTIDRFILGLEAEDSTYTGASTPSYSEERSRVIAETLDNLDLAETHFTSKRAEIGNRLNKVENMREQHSDQTLLNEELISNISDVDYNKAISDLSFQSFVLEAAQQTFPRVAGLSLFNFL